MELLPRHFFCLYKAQTLFILYMYEASTELPDFKDFVFAVVPEQTKENKSKIHESGVIFYAHMACTQ
ncbi:unnamed protein product [Clavelina lepadiformis]|uniref:Uncharacterized protein n=1 Tax=Clavelina lepadiformis TaxID=159417 RepID=A0ABP0G483_CLALP